MGISKIGTPLEDAICEGIIYRLRSAPAGPVKYPYLIVSDNIENSNMSGHTDIITISSFRRAKDRLRKRKIRNGIGLEMMITPIRKLDGIGVAKWFEDIRELCLFCHSTHCQLILSSGANSICEMVSGRCFDAILRNCDIEPDKHWHEMEEWIEECLSRRVSV